MLNEREFVKPLTSSSNGFPLEFFYYCFLFIVWALTCGTIASAQTLDTSLDSSCACHCSAFPYDRILELTDDELSLFQQESIRLLIFLSHYANTNRLIAAQELFSFLKVGLSEID